MKKIIQKALVFVTAIMMSFSFLPVFGPVPAYAASKPQTAILTQCSNAENGGGESIGCVVITVVNILSVLVGIVGVIGIVVVGIQYLTAGGNEEQTRKAKRRLFEIVIGIALYFLVSALLNWLLPNFNPDEYKDASGFLPSSVALIADLGV